MIQKKISVSSLGFVLLMAYSAENFAQALTPVDGSLGVLSYTAQMPKTWNNTSTALDKAREILSKDQVQLKPAFAYEGPKGNLLFGTWKDLKPGVAFTVSQLNSDPPQFPEDWGVSPANLSSFTGAVEAGIEYSGFSVTGMGDGKNFGKGKPVKTYGVWFDLPIAYQDASGSHSGLASIYYRSTESESLPTSAGVKFAQNLLNNLKLAPGVRKISADEYKTSYGSKPPIASQTKSSSAERVAAVKDSSGLESKVDMQNFVGILYNEKGTMFCFNYGSISQAPCGIAQPGTNKAEVNSAVIQQLNSIASKK